MTILREYVLCSYVDKHNDWDLQLPKIFYVINSAWHEVTGHNPNFLNFARHVPLSGSFEYEVKMENFLR